MTGSGSIRLLYIDDDEALARLVSKHFGRRGYEIETAASGRQGLARLREGTFDVVALDHYMPGQDGLETLKAIQAEPAPPPVVYVTGTEEGRVAIAALKAGAADYVIKDVGGEFLLLLEAAIEGVLADEKLRRDKEAAEDEVRAARDRFEALALERAMLLREVNHRVGNSLQLVCSFLHMQRTSDVNPEAAAALATAYGRVIAIAQVHKRLYTSDDVRSISLDQYLHTLTADIESSSGTSGGWLSLTADAVSIDPDRAVAVGIIVTELVINAMKYAYADETGPVRVILQRCAEQSIRLCVEDDGAGFSPPQSTSTGMGRLIVAAMADKLGATVTQDTEHQGTRMVLEFPKEQAIASSPPPHGPRAS
ncbi:sensor histidine kinase [Devosia nitrariae]|uniref:histidine kinase n=1 Tax=Devosia nitrariae TaxID=2071872 RepID=A0ABQ5W9F9_9HYPH|nr:response regulator [Devosia nitrariae]GLQ56185.1 two-component system sensor histidine kinase/response regulator [Devosia nitrariae]